MISFNKKDIRQDYSNKGIDSMQKKNYLQKLYEINPKTGNYLVEIVVYTYQDIFNDLDNAPVVKKDINHEIKDFLNNCSTDIPVSHGIDLVFNIIRDSKDEAKENQVKSAFKTYYSFYIHADKKELRQLYYRMIEYTAISVVFLLVGFFLEEKLVKSLIRFILFQGATIGGWVFLWQAMAFFIGERKDISKEIKILKRLFNANISFKYSK
jgi:CRISPR/Cas system-associated protein Csx1